MVFGLVIGDAFGDGGGGDIERGSDSSGAGHVGDSWLAGEEAGDGEGLGAETEIGFGAATVELGELDAHVGIGGGAVSEGLGLAAETGEVGIVGVVAIEHDDVGVHAEELGLGGEVGFGFVVIEIIRQEIGEGGGVDREAVEDLGVERLGGGGDDGVGDFGFPGVVEEFVEDGSLDSMVGS